MLPMFEITSCRVVEKYMTYISLKKHLACLEHYVHGRKDRSVDLIALLHIANELATLFIFR